MYNPSNSHRTHCGSADMVNGAMGTTVSIPVSVTGFDNICALSFSMHLVGTAGSVMGVSGFNLRA
ncbi:MAG: hypothetical protein R2788_06780 [Saprospiraceae bacterium]